MDTSQENISKLISYWLRHKPEDANLVVDEFGWTDINKLVSAIKEKHTSFSLLDLVNLNKGFDKVRWEINKECTFIRATHGHSFPVLLDDKNEIPPETLYHGTSLKTLPLIIERGLLPMTRQFVHLSENIEGATTVAKRHGKPFIIEIETKKLIEDGWKFYKTNENIWLTKEIPKKYLTFAPWYESFDKDKFTINELIREIGDRRNHILYPLLNNLKLVWATGTCDDKLFKDTTTEKYYMVHLTYTKKIQEIEGWPILVTYNSFHDWLEKGLWLDQQYFYDLVKD